MQCSGAAVRARWRQSPEPSRGYSVPWPDRHPADPGRPRLPDREAHRHPPGLFEPPGSTGGPGGFSPTGPMGPKGVRVVPTRAKLSSARRLTEFGAALRGLLGRRRARGPTTTDALLTRWRVGSNWVWCYASCPNPRYVERRRGSLLYTRRRLSIRRKLAARVSNRAIAAGMIICSTVRK